MKRPVVSVLISLILIAFCSSASATLSKEERISDASSIIDLFEHRYAPAPWKKTLFDIDMNSLGETLLSEVSKDISDEEFYTSLAKYLAGLKDAHVKPMIPSSYRVTLGFDVDFVGRETVITHIYRHMLDKEKFPFNEGDRLDAIDGISTDKIIDQLSGFYTTGMEQSDNRINAMNLTWRDQSSFPIIPEGSSEVTITPVNSKKQQTVILDWMPMGMPLAPTQTRPALEKTVSHQKALQGPLDRLRSIPAVLGKKEITGQEYNPYAPLFPLWPTFEKVENAPFLAGTATVGDKKLAFIKISTFMDPFNVQLEVQKFLSEQIPIWEDSTDAMIIDTVGNSGGYVCYGDDIASYLISAPIEAPKFKIKPTRSWSVEFEMELEWTKEENDREIIQQTVNEIREALATGTELTKPLPICRADGKIIPATELGFATKTYTKPVLILVDELNASAGEIFPATLQDAGRAKVFGSRTMGAGGSVTFVGPVGNSDITVSITESLVWRTKEVTAPDGIKTNYLENVGVIPDFKYDLTLDDILNHHEGYLSALENAVLSITSP